MDHDALLAPLSPAQPCGEDLSFSTEFDGVQELRRADDPSLDQGEWVTALKAADWPGVKAACEQLLATRSKDLRLAAWLTEAEARLAGFAGLAEGLGLCAALCERFWAELYPRIDADGDADERAGSLRWLLAQVQALARQLPVLRQGTRGLSLQDIDAARAAPASADGGDAPAAPSLTPDDVAAARRATPQAFFVANVAAARAALEALDRLQAQVDAQLGSEGPGFSPARRALEDTVHAVRRFAGDAEPAGAAEPAEAGATGGAGAPTGALRTRADALRQLRAVADFFRRTEPHSPVAYLAERGAQWGEMPLHEWLRSVVKDEGVLAQVEELLGVAAARQAAE